MLGAAFIVTLVSIWPIDYELLRVEDARGDAAPLVAALKHSDPNVVRQAIRALGRFERSELASAVVPFLGSPEAATRIEAANALAQMKTPGGLAPHLERDVDPEVRAALYEAIGRLDEASEAVLLPGLEENEVVRLGAMKGLESLFRTRELRPSENAVTAIRKAVRTSTVPALRELGLLALNRASDRDRETLEACLRDPAAGVRRLAVLGLKEWRDDPSPLVRYEALKVAADCRRAEASLSDPSAHVSLLAIDLLARGCTPEPLERVLSEPSGWRRQAHALVALAALSPERARPHLGRFVTHPVWQARVYAARAAKTLGAREEMKALRSDSHPNVIAEALVTPEDALASLASTDYGLLMTALPMLKGFEDRARAVPVLLENLDRVSQERKRTSRDPRRLFLERLQELGDETTARRLEHLLRDFDPATAALAAEVISEKTRRKVEPETTRFAPDPTPPPAVLRGLEGARATIRMKEAGRFVVALLPEVAPLTVAQFVKLSESGYYEGLTFHRIVPNFVIQGGSPGANEYVGTPGYIRDEVSRLAHERGTLGISTRGRDTGDSQIFVNLADNYRLDHNYTVFARVVEGMEAVDAIQEGDVIEAIQISRQWSLTADHFLAIQRSAFSISRPIRSRGK
jgi:cyclophilin family peptidyl-prolyl cis-trans isomerase/HEAT repeat protein